jgi:hypothetical protein
MSDCKTARFQAKGDSAESIELLRLLRLPIAAGQANRTADRLRELHKLFAALGPDRAQKLLARLNDPKDLLGVFFDCELSTNTRKQLRGILANTGTASQKPANPRAIDNRATNSPAVTSRSTTTRAAGPLERAIPAELQEDLVSGIASATSAPQPVIDCAAEWQSYETSARDVLSMAKPTEHRLRNMQITARYALLYLGNPEFKWAGFAAYASKQVGCAMDHGQRIARLAMAAGTYYPMKQDDEALLDAWDELATTLGGYRVVELANLMYAKLGEGNQKLFLDIFPAHLFFIDHGYRELARCSKTRKPALSSQLLEGFRLIEESRNSANRSLLLEMSVAAMARHEQLNILQPVIYDDRTIRAILDLNELDLPGADPAKAILTSECFDPGERNTYYLNDTRQGDKELYDPTDRMEWILDRIAPHYFALEGSARHISDMTKLTRIIYN